MNCRDARQFLDGYLDGELDLVRSTEFEAHIEDCGPCLQAIESRKTLSRAIRGADLRFGAPRGLEKRVLASVRNENRPGAAAAGRPRRPMVRFSLAFGVAATVLIVVLGWSALRGSGRYGAQNLLVQEVVASHIRSLQARHLLDVASTDQHTVKPWFLGKLDYSPPVVDLADVGFPLTGGRLDYLDGRPVAALVYHRRLHVINLFVWPADRGWSSLSSRPAGESIRGYHTTHWSHGGMTYYAVSDVNPADLELFTREVTARIGG